MAAYHVNASYIRKGSSQGGATGFATYLERLHPDNATQFRRYLERDGHGAEDLVASHTENLPYWAQDGPVFWKQADTWEREGGIVGRHYQFTLPRELAPEGRRMLADDIRTVFFDKYVHTWAIHEPHAHDGSGTNPHLHVFFSPRRDDLARQHGPKQWFGRATNRGQDPLSGGVRKDPIWEPKRTLQGVRYEYAILANAALEREGIAAAISSERLEVRGLGRRGTHYHQFGKEEHTRAIQERQATLRQNGTRAVENLVNLDAWRQQKAREGIRDISRGAMIDFTRDRFWRHDCSEAREQERQHSLLRAVTREYERADKARDTKEQERTRDRGKSRQWQSPFHRTTEDGMRQGVHVHLERERV